MMENGIPLSTSPGGQSKPRPIYPPNSQSYNLQALIGKEPKATIWLGEVKDSREQVAIKIIDLENLDNKTLEGLKKRLQKNEFSNHPNIVNYLCSFCDGNNLWVIMNYLAGGTVSYSFFPCGSSTSSVADSLLLFSFHYSSLFSCFFFLFHLLPLSCLLIFDMEKVAVKTSSIVVFQMDLKNQ
jgi:serine/threonine protein kinase